MVKGLYEFYISFFGRDINCAYYLDVDRETEKFYFGQAILLNKNTGENVEKYSRFRVEKAEINMASSHRDYHGNDIFVARVLGDNYFDAKDKALLAFGRYFRSFSERVIDWANELERNVSLDKRIEAACEMRMEAGGECKVKDGYEREIRNNEEWVL